MRVARSALLGLAMAALPFTVDAQQPRPGQGAARPDRQACHAWAVAQSGFDPARPPPSAGPGGPDAAGHDRALAEQRQAQMNSYNRALQSCLRGRGGKAG